MRKALFVAALAAAVAIAPAHANLLVNGDFEASSSPTATPPGWTNIGHSDGVIAYSQFSTPAYDGRYFYDLGGFGNASGPVGDGIAQTVITVAGQPYTLTFGLSSEDVRGTSTLDVTIGGLLTQYTQGSTGTFLGKGFTTQTINYIATGATTTIRFIESFNSSGGNNDPLIDGVIFEGRTAVAEPASAIALAAGLGALAFSRRRSR